MNKVSCAAVHNEPFRLMPVEQNCAGSKIGGSFTVVMALALQLIDFLIELLDALSELFHLTS